MKIRCDQGNDPWKQTHRYPRASGENGLSSGARGVGFSTATNLPLTTWLNKNLWLKIIVPHPPYSIDLTSRDVVLFPKLKLTLKGRRFDDIITIQEKHRVSANVFNTEAKARLAVSCHKEPSLKRIAWNKR
jgi:hypothetical protein